MPTEDDFQRLLERDAKTMVSYVPYGAQDQIKLTATTVQNLIAVKTRKGHTCSYKDAIKFIAMCQAKRLNPFEGDCFLIGYDTNDGPSFALVTAHQTYLKRAELHAEFDGMASGLIVKDEDGKLSEIEGDFFDQGQDVVGGWAKVYFKNRKHPMYKRLRMARFNTGFAQWKADAPGMICKCAEADALRSAFPTMLGGLYMQDEKQPEEPKLAKPDFSKSTPLFAASDPTLMMRKVAEGEAINEIRSNPQEPEPQPDADDDYPSGLEPQPAVQQSAPSNGGQNYLKAVRGLCKMGNIKEGELLNFLSETGSTDGSIGTLEELGMSASEVLKLCHDQWASISANIVAARKGGAK